MDRREFLKSTTVAAAAATSTATVATAALATPTAMYGPSPARAAGAREFVLAVPQSLDHIEIMTAAHRMAARLQTSFGGARFVTVTSIIESGLEAIQTGCADAYLGLDSQHAHQHPAFALLSSAPIGEHMDGPTHHAWLASHREPWHDLAAEFGTIAFPAFHTPA
jgi:TRAP-type mannitol/chloroaromatic compound transport system substrate-binding protein